MAGLAAALLVGCLVKWIRDRGLGRRIDVVEAASTSRYRINVNTASAAELRLLPGVGPEKANRIVAWRKAHGAFKRPSDLAAVPGLSAKSVAVLQPLITCSPGPAP